MSSGIDRAALVREHLQAFDARDLAAIAAFFRFTGEQISEVKVYREGSADP